MCLSGGVCIEFPNDIYMIVQVGGIELLWREKDVTSCVRVLVFELANLNFILISFLPFLVWNPCVTWV